MAIVVSRVLCYPECSGVDVVVSYLLWFGEGGRYLLGQLLLEVRTEGALRQVSVDSTHRQVALWGRQSADAQ